MPRFRFAPDPRPALMERMGKLPPEVLAKLPMDNVGELDLTPAGQESGLWYGKADYMGGFAQLWAGK